MRSSQVVAFLPLRYDSGPHTGTASCDHLCPQCEDVLLPHLPPFFLRRFEDPVVMQERVVNI